MGFTERPFTEAGDWRFESDKEELVIAPASGNQQPVTWTIIKLMNRHLWLRDASGSVVKEIHYKKK